MVDLMKIEDPFAPPGDQPDLNKLRRTKRPLPVLGRNLFCVLQLGLLLSGSGGGLWFLPPSGPTKSLRTSASFIGAAGWKSGSWSPGWRAVSWRWGPAGHAGRAADRLGWCPPAPIPHHFPPSDYSAALDTQSGHSGTPRERRKDPVSDGSAGIPPWSCHQLGPCPANSEGAATWSERKSSRAPLPWAQTPGSNYVCEHISTSQDESKWTVV